MASERNAEIVFPIPLKRQFTYRVPAALMNLAQPGMRCSVSFGRRRTVGLITGLTDHTPAHAGALKDVDSLLDVEPSIPKDLLELGRWIADYYYCSLGEALFAILPAGYRKNPRAFLGLLPEARGKREEVEALLEKAGSLRGVNWESLEKGRIPITARTKGLAEVLRKAGLGAVRFDALEEGPEKGKHGLLKAKTSPFQLHPQQEAALAPIERAIEQEAFQTFLLQGVTGSGKTEVYLRAIEKVLAKGKQAIVLIPEIALTPQTEERFITRFGGRVAVLHSRLSLGERSRQWRRVASGEAPVAVGARSALFAPAQRLGLIVVDEEHEASYKQEDSPRYHARDAAVKRAQLCGAVAILGSATPSLESVQNARAGKYVFLTLPERVNQKPLPRVRVVDLKEEWRSKGEDRPVLSLSLQQAMGETLARGEQVMLFLNRRGFNTLTLCLKCGEQLHCPSCSVPVTSHRSTVKAGSVLLCHYCGWTGPVPAKCAACKDGEVKQIGLGTERVEEEIRAAFPDYRVARMDLDTTRGKGGHAVILGKFIRKEIDVLIGTQMIAKGHDFPGVTLVGIIGADVGLALPDFRSSERVFQLLVQVSGRAGRADKEGVIYLQTFHPEHPGIQAAARHDTESFFKGELELRRALEYPPFSKLGLLVYRGKDDKKVRLFTEKAAEVLRKEAKAFGVEVTGPAPAPLYKLRGQYRYQILMKAPKPHPLRRLLEKVDAALETPPGLFRVVDLDPQSML